MYAIIKTGGKQYRVQKGDVISVEKLPLAKENQKTYKFNEVLFVEDNDKTLIGTPLVKGAAVEAKVLEVGKSEKVVIYKYKSKKDYRKKQGHRQPFTKLEISKITVAADKKAEKDEEAVAVAAEEKKETVKKAPAKKAPAKKAEGDAPAKKAPAKKAPAKKAEGEETVKKAPAKKAPAKKAEGDAPAKKAPAKKAPAKKAEETKE